MQVHQASSHSAFRKRSSWRFYFHDVDVLLTRSRRERRKHLFGGILRKDGLIECIFCRRVSQRRTFKLWSTMKRHQRQNVNTHKYLSLATSHTFVDLRVHRPILTQIVSRCYRLRDNGLDKASSISPPQCLVCGMASTHPGTESRLFLCVRHNECDCGHCQTR